MHERVNVSDRVAGSPNYPNDDVNVLHNFVENMAPIGTRDWSIFVKQNGKYIAGQHRSR